ncbi:MAG: response regulator [Bacteroidales bacterium]|nr:response regulator [Bacteroidales bacterium]
MELPRILYVDDEIINLELLQITFKNDFKVITAESAEEGLRLLVLNPDIQVVISDLKMPVMNGLDFIKRVKQNDQKKVCMLLTGYMESNVMLEGFNKELIFRYLIKPWNKDELNETIREALSR